MCRRFRLIAAIETATIDDIVKFVRSTALFYMLLTVLSVIYAVLLYFDEVLFIFSVIGAVMYALCSVSYRLLAGSPTEDYCHGAMVLTIILLVEKIVSAIYFYSNASSLISSIISILIQSSTIYILFKLRQKLNEKDATVTVMEQTVAAPFGYNNEP